MIIIYLLIFVLLSGGFLFWASYSINSGIYIKVFCRKQTKEKIVALTFDDGPDTIQTPRILQVLKKEQIPACFFCIGKKVKGNEELLREIVAEGHLIGNHSYSHTGFFPLYNFKRMKEDLQTCQSALETVTSQPVTLFRPPFGVTNPTIAQAVRQLGYKTIGWNIRTLDTQYPAPEKILRRIRKRLCPGSVILLHDRLKGSDVLLQQVIRLVKKQGYTIVRLDSMF